MDSRGFVFSMDLLLSLIIVTMAIGMVTSSFEELNFQMQDFTGRQSLERTVNDAADYLVKSSGNPVNWEKSPNSNTIRPGLALFDRYAPANNFIDTKKVTALHSNPSLISNLVYTNNFQLTITRLNTSESSSTYPYLEQFGNSPPSTAKEIAVANRTVVIPTYKIGLNMSDLMHMNPGHEGEPNNFLWYSKGGDNDYVGPGNVTTIEDGNSSFYISPEALNTTDFYIYITENTATQGSPVNTAFYGFTGGNAVVNGSYGDMDDKARDDAVSDELKRVYGGNGWQKIDNLAPGSLNLINEDIQAAIDAGINPQTEGLKFWLTVKSNPQATFSLSVIQVYKGEPPFKNIPANLVLKIWE